MESLKVLFRRNTFPQLHKASLLRNKGLVVMPTPGNGHRLVHAVLLSRLWQLEEGALSPPCNVTLQANVDDVIVRMRAEYLEHAQHYAQLTAQDSTTLADQMEDYLTDKKIDNDFYHIALYIIAKTENLTIRVINSCGEQDVNVIDIYFSTDQIFIYRENYCYSALARKPCEI